MYYTQEQIDRANQADLVSFLQSQGEQLTRAGNEYRWKRREAVKAGDFTVFNKHMKPLERKYWRVSIPFKKRMMNLVKRAINKLGRILKKL